MIDFLSRVYGTRTGGQIRAAQSDDDTEHRPLEASLQNVAQHSPHPSD